MLQLQIVSSPYCINMFACTLSKIHRARILHGIWTWGKARNIRLWQCKLRFSGMVRKIIYKYFMLLNTGSNKV